MELLGSGSAGIVYPSVRHTEGVCIACFRPPLVLNVREGTNLTFIFMRGDVTSIRVDE
jgi:hypothetical protein